MVTTTAQKSSRSARPKQSKAVEEKVRQTNMSLDNTSHPGGPGRDELVPSRYALRVGEIDVLVVSETLPEVTMETGLAGWGGRTRTQKCRRKLSL